MSNVQGRICDFKKGGSINKDTPLDIESFHIILIDRY